MRWIMIAVTLLTPAAQATRPDPVSVRFAATTDGGYEIDGAFDAPASSATAWQVLTDYDDLPHFVSSLRRSRILRRAPCLVVEQESEVHSWIFFRRVRVVLNVEESPMREIRFCDLAHVNFSNYDGSWSLREIPGGTRVSYELRAKGGLGVPRRLASGAARRAVAALLEEVRAEMERRASRVASSGR